MFTCTLLLHKLSSCDFWPLCTEYSTLRIKIQSSWIPLLRNHSLEKEFYFGTQEKTNEDAVGLLKQCER